MSVSRTIKLDSSIAVGLIVALGVVFLLDRAAPPESQNPTPAPTITAPPEPVAPPLRLAVTPHRYDDMGKLLGQLGSGFAFTNIPAEALEETSKLVEYDVIFLTCNTDSPHWLLPGDLGQGNRPGVHRAKYNEEIMDKVKEAVRNFVGRGGTLYASDWRLSLINRCFPELFEGQENVEGDAQTLVAEVVDEGLRDVLGSSVELKFDLPGWRPATFAADKAKVYLRGEYTAKSAGQKVMAPLLVTVPFEKGTIIFTSFHNEKVNSEVETKLLKFLVFAAVIAKETSQAQQTMLSSGFSPKKQSLLSASPENPPVVSMYKNDKRRPLRFVLSFRNEGAELLLAVRGPTGQPIEQAGVSTFNIDIPDAAAGDWTCTVTARKVPYANFPFSLSVGGN
jgi:hypothetical protein